MGINKHSTSSISIVGQGIAKSATGISCAHKKIAKSLEYDNDFEEENRISLGRGSGSSVSINSIIKLADPKMFLNKKAQQKWEKMSPQRREKLVQKEVSKAYKQQKMKYFQAGTIEEAMKSTGNSNKKTDGIASRTNIKNIRPINFSQKEGELHFDEYQDLPQLGVESKSNHKVRSGARANLNSSLKQSNIPVKTFTESHLSGNPEAGTQLVGNAIRNSVEKSAEIAQNAAGGVATMGAQTAAKAAQHVADKFKNTLEQSVVQSSEQLAMTLKENISQNQSTFIEKLPNMVVKPAAAIIAIAAKGISGIASGIMSVFLGMIAIVSGIVIIGTLLFVIISGIFGASTSSGGGGQAIVQVARQELSVSGQNIGGAKYKQYMGMNVDWCAMFLSWCANECGYIESGIMPKNASVSGWMEYFTEKSQYHEKQGFSPQAGDIVIFKNGMSHIGVVVETSETTISTIEGNSGNSIRNPYHEGSSVTLNQYPLSYGAISGYCRPAYPNDGNFGNLGAPELTEGAEILIPGGLGNIHTYMGWSLCSAQSSEQYRLRMDSKEPYDAEGFGRIGNRYVVACTTTYGKVGDYVDFYQADGSVIQGIIGDIKNQNDPGCNKWGHMNGVCVIEFCVDYSQWYNPFHSNPGTNSCHPEWGQYIIKAVNRGSYWG